MKLQLYKRTGAKRSEVNQLRREGKIPAIIYAKGKDGEKVAVENTHFLAAMRHVKQGHLPTTVFTLTDGGKDRRVIIKDIQYNVTNYDVIHLDLEELHENVLVTVKVPIECTGVVDCVGVKLGGILRQVLRYIRVRCLPKDIPTVLEVDVRNLEIQQSLRLSDLQISKKVRPLMSLNEVAVAVVRK